MEKYYIENTVKSYEVDVFGRITLPNIFYYFQEAANNHASALNWGWEYLTSIQKFWVLSRLRLKIDYYPTEKDKITIETWSRGAIGFFAYRDYRILLGGKCCMNATSSWIILDHESHRPCKTDQLEKKIPGISESYLSFPESRIQALNQKTLLMEKKVNFSDIDKNKHVNNGKYIEILTDSISDILIEPKTIQEIDIQYIQESKLNDQLIIYSETDFSNTNSAQLLLNVEKKLDGKEICRSSIFFQ